MFEKRISSPEEVEPYVIEVSTNFVRDGRTIHIDDDLVPAPFDADYGDRYAYRLLRGFKGPHAIVPKGRAVFVEEINGIHVPAEMVGLSVNIPIVGTREERREDPFWTDPSRNRFIVTGERHSHLHTHSIVGKLAVAQAVFQVVNGIGEQESRDHFDTLKTLSQQNRRQSDARHVREQAITREMERIDPTFWQFSMDNMAEGFESLKDNSEGSSERFAATFDTYATVAHPLRAKAIRNLGFDESDASI